MERGATDPLSAVPYFSKLTPEQRTRVLGSARHIRAGAGQTPGAGGTPSASPTAAGTPGATATGTPDAVRTPGPAGGETGSEDDGFPWLPVIIAVALGLAAVSAAGAFWWYRLRPR